MVAEMEDDPMRVGSLFSGIGGMDLGLERAGMEIAWQVEIDPWCQRVLAKHWPDVPCFGDVKELNANGLPPVDVLAGGFPCQPVSNAGKGKAQEDERWLWPEFARIIRAVRPRFVFVENVPGLTNRGLDLVLGSLAALGFDAEWTSLSAAAFGAPHIRDRIVIVAHANGERQLEQGRTVSEIGRRSGNSGETLAHPQVFTERAGFCPDQSTEEWWGRLSDSGCSTSQWSVEPSVGRSLDGFSAWLDRSGQLSEAHELVCAHANAEKGRPTEVLRELRHRTAANLEGWAAGGPWHISPAEVLLAFLCKLPSRNSSGDIPLASEETSETGVRSVRANESTPRSSLRRKPREQRPEQSSDSLHALSQLLARLAESAWIAYRRSDASPSLGWESGIARVANGIPSRLERLRGLGNAIVPQLAEFVGRRIMEVAA